jgi:hypothetical protein
MPNYKIKYISKEIVTRLLEMYNLVMNVTNDFIYFSEKQRLETEVNARLCFLPDTGATYDDLEVITNQVFINHIINNN